MKPHERLVEPTFIDVKYDERNIETPGKYRGVGEAGKVGLNNCSSYDPMPPKAERLKVKRDHEG